MSVNKQHPNFTFLILHAVYVVLLALWPIVDLASYKMLMGAFVPVSVVVSASFLLLAVFLPSLQAMISGEISRITFLSAIVFTAVLSVLELLIGVYDLSVLHFISGIFCTVAFYYWYKAYKISSQATFAN